MSNNQKISSTLLKDKRIQEELSKRFGSRPYWTFQEGINFFLPIEYRNSFPLSVIINDYLFETLKREVETQQLETINDIEEVKQILSDLESNSQWTISKKGRKLSFSERQEGKRRYFCSKIKIRPEILICYIIDNIDLFSSEIEIPSKLQAILQTVENLSVTENENVIKPTKEEVEELLMDVSPELERLFDTTQNTLKKKPKDTTTEEICNACHKAYQTMLESQETVDKISFMKEDDIDCSKITNNIDKLSRELKGPILLSILFRKYRKSDLKTLSIPTNYQKLYECYTRLQNSPK